VDRALVKWWLKPHDPAVVGYHGQFGATRIFMVLATRRRSKAVGAVDACDLRSLIGDLERSIGEDGE
jgi:hypothetical protein